MEIAISSATSSANTKNSISLQSGEPDWSMIPSAKKSNKTQAEFVDEIKELARKAANTTSKAELENIHRQRTSLCAEYMSDVSPNRKALYQQAKNAVKSSNHNPKCQGIGELSLLDFLEKAEGNKSDLAEKKFVLAGGGTLVCPILTSGGYGADIYYQGTKALTYLGSGYGWACERTPAEREKEKGGYQPQMSSGGYHQSGYLRLCGSVLPGTDETDEGVSDPHQGPGLRYHGIRCQLSRCRYSP